MNIGDRHIGGHEPCFIVAEIGINHNGNITTALDMIDKAKECGAEAVKFQKRTIEVVYTEEELARPRESPFGKTNGDLKRGLEFGYGDYTEINNHCNENGIVWFASPWDIASVDFLDIFDLPVYKVASACLTDDGLLEKMAATGAEVIMSTGMSTEEQIIGATKFFGHDRLALLACTSTYPCKLEDLHLNRLFTLNDLFPQCALGYSNHYPGPWPSLCAVGMGAEILEVHVTLDRSMWGSDQSASLEFSGFAKLVREIRDYEKALGSGELRILQSERANLEKLRRFK